MDEKFDIKKIYLLCFIFVDTAFLLCGAALLSHGITTKVLVRHRLLISAQFGKIKSYMHRYDVILKKVLKNKMLPPPKKTTKTQAKTNKQKKN